MAVSDHAEKMPAFRLWPGRLLWLSLLAVTTLDVVWILWTARPVDFTGSGITFVCMAFALCALLSAPGTVRESFRVAASGIAFVILCWPVLRVFNHLMMTLPFPFADPMLARWDHALGFNWLGYLHWADHYPRLLAVMKICYWNLTTFSSVVFVALLVLDGNKAAREFIVLFFVAAIVATSIGAMFPAIAAMAYYAPPAASFAHITPDFGTYHLASLYGLRNDPAHVLRLSQMPGLTTFPSFHTAMGVITIYCARRRLAMFLPALAFNGMMIASTPVFGSHYFIDVIAGGALAAALILALKIRDGAFTAWFDARFARVSAVS